MGYFSKAVEGFRLRYRPTPYPMPDPLNYAYDSFGMVSFAGFAGDTFFQQIAPPQNVTVAPFSTVLVGQAPIYDNVINQPLTDPGQV